MFSQKNESRVEARWSLFVRFCSGKKQYLFQAVYCNISTGIFGRNTPLSSLPDWSQFVSTIFKCNLGVMQKVCPSPHVALCHLSFRLPPPMSLAKKWQTLMVKINYHKIFYLSPSGDSLIKRENIKGCMKSRLGNLIILICLIFLGGEGATSLFGLIPLPHVTLCNVFSLTPSP